MDGYFDPQIPDRYPAFGEFVRSLRRTELMEMPRRAGAGAVFAKCEMQQPQGTIKDRVSCALMWDLLQTRNPGLDELRELEVLECTGSSLGLSLAQICRALEIRLKLVVPDNIDEGFVTRLTNAGAELIYQPIETGFYEVYARGMTLSEEHPEWAYLGQHRNKANLEFHRTNTGKEIVEQLDGRTPDGWVAAIGTGGTLIGVYKALSAVNPEVKAIAVTPAEMPYCSHRPPLPGRRMAGSSGWFRRSHTLVEPFEAQLYAHHLCWFRDCARVMREFYDETGMQLGSSSAANLLAARTLAERLGPQSTVVTVFPAAAHQEEWDAAIELGKQPEPRASLL